MNISDLHKMTLFSIIVLIFLLSSPVTQADWRESFSSTSFQPPPGTEISTDVGHKDKKSLKIVAKKGLDSSLKGLKINPEAKILWLDFYLRSPKKPIELMFALSNKDKNRKYYCALGLDSGRKIQGYGVRSTRDSASIKWPRYHQVTTNIYTGEKYEIKPQTWIRLTARMDFQKNLFDVYRDRKLVFCEMEMSENSKLPNTLILSISSRKGGPAKESQFYLDDLYLGEKRPEGIEAVPFYPAKPSNLVLRFAIVGDTQIPYGLKHANQFSTMGLVVPTLNKIKPDLTFFVGDLISQKELKPEQYAESCKKKYSAWMKQASELKFPYYPIRGNHDPLPYYTEMVKKEIDFVVEKNGYTFICFSDAHLTDVDGWHHFGEVSKKQLKWLEKEMQKAQKKGNKIITVTHITSMINKHPLVGWYVKNGRQELHELYRKYGVLMEISGHMHRWLVNRYENGLWFIVAPTVMEGGGRNIGHGIMIYDVLPDKILQYEKLAKGTYLTAWGKWAKHEIPINNK